MSPTLAESELEQAVLDWFAELRYQHQFGPDILPGSLFPEREHPDEAFLPERLRSALARLNPTLPPDAIQQAYRKTTVPDSPALLQNNRDFHRLLTEGVPVDYRGPEGRDVYETAALLDFYDPDNNDWLVVNQFSVVQNPHHRRADVVVFVNGLPLAVVELKNPGSETASVEAAFHQLETYQHEIPNLFLHNEVLVASDGLGAKAAPMTSGWEWFLPWKTIEGDVVNPPGTCQLEVLIKGIFEKRRFLDLLRHFIVFASDGSKITKKMARYHQFHAVNRALECTIDATAPSGDRKVGVVWHTQGSGKSLTMVFYAAKVCRHPAMHNPTLVVLTDRNDLDDQLFGTFSACQGLLGQEPVQAEDRAHLQELLRVPSGGIVFTTIQKFMPEPGSHYPRLSDRSNIVVICDEAHRSQYDFLDGFARHIRDALPNASFVAFTGTPVELVGKNTRAVFGDYIDVYDVHRAVEDGATVPIYYEGRLIELSLKEEDRELLDEEFDDITEDQELEQREKLKTKWARLEALVGAQDRIDRLAADLVEHFDQRQTAIDGKGMIVCMSRRICVELYEAIRKLRPEWAGATDDEGSMKIVMTGSAADPVDWQQHIRSKSRREALAERFKDPDDHFRLVIVRDMWLTGFDAPCLHTMYMDKPAHGHGLMQAIARVNRVFRDKPGGLIVDYLGLADNLRRALAYYSQADQEVERVDQAQAVAKMLEEYEVVRAMFHGFDYSACRGGILREMLPLAVPAIEHILAQDGTGDQDPRKRFLGHTAALSQAFALSVPHKRALGIRDEVGFFQLVRAALVKVTGEGAASEYEREAAIRQIISRAVLSGDVVDIFSAAGLMRPDISILSEQFLAEVRSIKYKNAAAEALRKLIEDEIRVRERKNPLEARSFLKLLEDSIKRYRNRTIEAAQVIEELIEIAREVREAAGRGEKMGLSDDELAFYDALADNESAVDVMGDEQLRIIAHELVDVVRRNATIDWSVRDSTRAHLRVLVKRILRQYGYPPDLQQAATENVLEQAEQLCEFWVAA